MYSLACAKKGSACGFDLEKLGNTGFQPVYWTLPVGLGRAMHRVPTAKYELNSNFYINYYLNVDFITKFDGKSIWVQFLGSKTGTLYRKNNLSKEFNVGKNHQLMLHL